MKRIITWNVNSVNSRLERCLKLIERHEPDLLCLQEIKTLEEKFPKEAFEKLGYHCAVFGQKTYNGVAVLSKETPQNIVKGFQDGDSDLAARFIMIQISDLWVASAYVPNGQQVGSEAYQYKLLWLSRLRKFLDESFSSEVSLVVAGDFNVIPEDKDVYDPDVWRGKILYSDPEVRALNSVYDFGLFDTFRRHHSQGGQYSWWDYRQLAFPLDRGLRIDFILATEPLLQKCTCCFIDRDERKGEKPSDHAPVVGDFEL